MSGSGERMRESSTSSSTISDGSPRRDFVGLPVTPTTSPRCTSTSPVRAAGQSSWIRPLRSTRSRKTSFPMSRRAITRPARRRSSAPSAPGSSASASARTAAISSRSGKRFGVVGSRPLDHSPGVRPVLAASRLRARPRSRAGRRRRGCASLFVSSTAGRPSRRGRVEARLEQRRADSRAAAPAGRRRSRRGTSAGPASPRRASPRPRGRRRGTARSPRRARSGVVTSARSVGADAHRRPARRQPARGAEHGARPSPRRRRR